MQTLIVALEVNVSAIHYLQGKEKTQLKARNMNTRGISNSVLIVQAIAFWAHHKGFPKIISKTGRITSRASLLCHPPLSFLVRVLVRPPLGRGNELSR